MNRFRWLVVAGCAVSAVAFAPTAIAESETPGASPQPGVMDNSAPGDHKVTDALSAIQMDYLDWVRQMRMDLQVQQFGR